MNVWQETQSSKKDVWSDAHPAYQGGDGPAEPVVDVENQEAADRDEEAVWRGEETADDEDVQQVNTLGKSDYFPETRL